MWLVGSSSSSTCGSRGAGEQALSPECAGESAEEGQQHLRLLQQRLAEPDPHLPPAREGGHRQLGVRRGEAHRTHHPLGALLDGARVGRVQLRLQLRHRVERALHRVGVLACGGERRLRLVVPRAEREHLKEGEGRCAAEGTLARRHGRRRGGGLLAGGGEGGGEPRRSTGTSTAHPSTALLDCAPRLRTSGQAGLLLGYFSVPLAPPKRRRASRPAASGRRGAPRGTPAAERQP